MKKTFTWDLYLIVLHQISGIYHQIGEWSTKSIGRRHLASIALPDVKKHGLWWIWCVLIPWYCSSARICSSTLSSVFRLCMTFAIWFPYKSLVLTSHDHDNWMSLMIIQHLWQTSFTLSICCHLIKHHSTWTNLSCAHARIAFQLISCTRSSKTSCFFDRTIDMLSKNQHWSSPSLTSKKLRKQTLKKLANTLGHAHRCQWPNEQLKGNETERELPFRICWVAGNTQVFAENLRIAYLSETRCNRHCRAYPAIPKQPKH